MTERLERAIARARKLPAAQQDALAALIMEEIAEEIADEARWDSAFARSRGILERLGAEAADEERLGLPSNGAAAVPRCRERRSTGP